MVTELLIVIGLIVVIAGVISAFYGFYKKKWSVSDTLKIFLFTAILGLVSFMSDLDFDIVSTKLRAILILFILVLGFFLLKIKGKSDDDGAGEDR